MWSKCFWSRSGRVVKKPGLDTPPLLNCRSRNVDFFTLCRARFVVWVNTLLCVARRMNLHDDSQQDGWYKRHENNGWRLVSDRLIYSAMVKLIYVLVISFERQSSVNKEFFVMIWITFCLRSGVALSVHCSCNVSFLRLQDPVTWETSRQAVDFHHVKLQRKADVERKRRQRKIEWMKKMYMFVLFSAIDLIFW